MPTRDELELERLRIGNETAEEALEKARSDRAIAEAKATDDREAARLARTKAEADAEVAATTAAQGAETTRIAQAKSKLDNEATKLDNEAKSRAGRQADYDSLAAKVAAAVPKVSQIPVNTITVPEDYAFREPENVGNVLDAAAAALVNDLVASNRLKSDQFPNLIITSDPNLAQSAVAYYAMKAEFETLEGEAITLRADAFALVGLPTPGGSNPLSVPGVGDVIASGVAAAATALTEVAGLFATDTTLTNVSSEPSAFTVHSRLTRRLIESVAGLTISTDRVTLVPETAPLLGLLQTLLTAYHRLADAAVTVQAKIDSSPGEGNAAVRAELDSMKTRVAALKARIEALMAKITTIPAGRDTPPLTDAIIHSTSAIADPSTSVLVVPPVKAYTDQVVVKRRIASPRVSVSTYLELPFMLLQAGQIVWAGCPTARTGSTTVFKRNEVHVEELKRFSFQNEPPLLTTRPA